MSLTNIVVILLNLFLTACIVFGVWNILLVPLFDIEAIDAFTAVLVAVIATVIREFFGAVSIKG